MRPLSFSTYYRRNKRKVLPVILILAFSIIGVTSTASLTDEIFRGQEALQNFYASYDTVSLNTQYTVQGGQRISTDAFVERHLSAMPEVKYYLKSVVQDVRFVRVLGDNDVPVFYIAPQDDQTLINQFGWKLTNGRLPRSNTNEIVLSENILQNKGWHIGDTVGNDIDKSESLQGSYKIVGEFHQTGSTAKGVTGGIGDITYAEARNPGFIPYTFLVHPKTDQGTQLDTKLAAFLKNVKVEDVSYSTLPGVLDSFSNDYNSAKVVLGLLNSVVVVVISISISLLYIIFLMQRANEFGLLAAIGYSRAFIIRKVLAESLGQVMIGWGLGLLLAQGVYIFANTAYFLPHGLLGANVFAPTPLLFSLPVPVVVIIVTTMTVFLQLGRLDPIAIIERRD